MKLSIVIPIYGVEKYIEKCLMSCILQDEVLGKDYEIVCVNDGTKDRSAEIAKEIASHYSGIVVIDQENGGLSAARNTGLSYAQGEYVWFVDSDDYIEENCLGRVVSFLKDDLDILQLQYRHVYEDNTPALDIKLCQIDGIKSGLDVTEQGGLPAPAQFSIYRVQFLKENKLEFVRGIYHEDTEFKPRVTYLARKIASDACISYNYLQRRSGSITSNFKLKNGLDILKVNRSLLLFADQQKMPMRYRKHLYCRIGMNMNSLLFGIRKLCKEDKQILTKELKMNKHIFHCMIQSGYLKYQIEGFIFKINISLGLLLHQIHVNNR